MTLKAETESRAVQGDDPPHPRDLFTRTLTDLGETAEDKIRLGQALDAFGERGFGAALLFLGLLNTLPLPPGSSTLLGFPVLLVSGQLLFGARVLSLPAWVSNRAISTSHFRSGLKRIRRPLAALEVATRPRWTFLTGGFGERVIGAVCVLLAIILMLPIWGGNLIPALIISLFGLGLMQRDGMVILVGWAMLAILLVLAWLVSGWILQAAVLAWDRVFEVLDDAMGAR